MSIEVAIAGQVATVQLVPGPAAAALVSQLPVTGRLRDDFGQAASLVLPRELDTADAATTRGWLVGEVAYDQDSGSLAFFHARDTESLAPPGLVRVGTVTSGLDAIAAAGPWASATLRVAG